MISDVLYGKVLSVGTQNLGEPAVADAAVGATTVYVADAASFDEVGGLLSVGGETLAYAAIDVDLDTITMAVPLVTAIATNDRLEVYPPTPIKTAFVDMLDNSDFLPATVPLNLLDRLPDGTREPDRQETVELTRRGLYEYVVADVTAEQVISQTLDFAEAEQGIGLSEQVAQFQDVNTLGLLSAAGITTDQLSLGGVDLQETIDAGPRGKILTARRSSGTNASPISTTEVALFTLNCGNIPTGRQYRIRTQMRFIPTVASDVFRFLYRLTTDGTQPTVSSPLMSDTMAEHYAIGSTSPTFDSDFEIGSDAPVQILISAFRISGTGTAMIYQGGSSVARIVMSLYDDGPTGARNDAAITQQLGLSEGVPITTYTKTFDAIWAWGSDGNGNELSNSWLWLGTDYLANYNFGMVGFDSTAIVAALAGVTTPTSVKLRWKPRSRSAASGLDVGFISHNFASLAAAKSYVNGQGDPVPINYFDYGSTYALVTQRDNTAPGTIYEESLGTTVFNQFKAGTKKGIGFAPKSNLNLEGTGSVYGDGASQCQLVFTYQGTS